MAPRPFRRSETMPFLPRAATRSASSAASSAAPALWPGRLRWSVARSGGRVVFIWLRPALTASLSTENRRKDKRHPAGSRVRTGARFPPGHADRSDAGEISSGSAGGALRLLDTRLERGRLADGKLGQDLAVDLDPGFAEAADKSAVGQTVQPDGGVDALDPQGAEG